MKTIILIPLFLMTMFSFGQVSDRPVTVLATPDTTTPTNAVWVNANNGNKWHVATLPTMFGTSAFTNASRASVSITTSGTGAASYNSSTGVFNVPTPDLSPFVTATALNGFTGSSNITTLGTVSNGKWEALSIADPYIGSSSYWNSAAALAGTALQTETDPLFDTKFSGKSTTALAEGTNLYWTAARFNTALAGKTTTDITEGINLYFTSARFNSALAAKTTSDIAEGSNLYFTNARVNAVAPTLSGSGATGTWPVSVTGNATTVTNGVYNNGAYSNPSWIIALDNSKITGLGTAALANSIDFASAAQGALAVTAVQPATLTSALSAKFNTPTGSSAQYLRGDGTPATFPTNVSTFTNDANYIGAATTNTLSNKTLSGTNNTFSNIGNSSLTNSSITINGNNVSLGGSTTITASSVISAPSAGNAITMGTAFRPRSTGSCFITVNSSLTGVLGLNETVTVATSPTQNGTYTNVATDVLLIGVLGLTLDRSIGTVPVPYDTTNGGHWVKVTRSGTAASATYTKWDV